MKKLRILAAAAACLMVASCALSGMTAYAKDNKVIVGDTNLDTKVNIKDATLIQKVTASLVEAPEHYMETSDVDLNGFVNVKDATTIQLFLVGRYKSLPINQPEQPTGESTATNPTDTTATTPTGTTESTATNPTDTTEPSTPAPTETTEPADESFAAQFVTDKNASVNIYYTQDYTKANETGVTSAIARNRDTGAADVSGEGQINFAVVLADGYVVDDIKIDGGYKNLKNIEENIYRVTKITSDLKITITTKKSGTAPTSEPVEPTTTATEPTTTATEPTTAYSTDGDGYTHQIFQP